MMYYISCSTMNQAMCALPSWSADFRDLDFHATSQSVRQSVNHEPYAEAGQTKLHPMLGDLSEKVSIWTMAQSMVPRLEKDLPMSSPPLDRLEQFEPKKQG
jgi:hypothetical protein